MNIDWDYSNGWINPAKELPQVFTKEGVGRYVKKILVTTDKGNVEIARWYPEHFMTLEFDDIDDYDMEDYPYLEEDIARGCVWVKEGFYLVETCGRCDNYWYEPINVIAWQYAPEAFKAFKVATDEKEN